MTECRKPVFGDYVLIEQKRFGMQNEMYLYKVIRSFESNSYVDVPVDYSKNGEKEIIHTAIVPVCSTIRCGVNETVVRKFRIDDVVIRNSGQDAACLDWLEGLVQVEFDHQNAKQPNFASVAAREAYRTVLDLIKARKEAKS